MDKDYWLERWREGRTRFHRPDVNPLLAAHRSVLPARGRILVPLCGKSLDLAWLAASGLEVIGVELSELAANAFFEEQGATPRRRAHGSFVELSAQGVSIWVGDFFDLAPELLGRFDGAYDRAALIALPPEMRARYAARLAELVPSSAPLLLITLYYDAPGGPPFSVGPEEVLNAFPDRRVVKLADEDGAAEAPGPLERGASFVRHLAYAIGG